MRFKNLQLYSLATESELLKALDINKELLNEALTAPYKRRRINNRLLEIPNCSLKLIQYKINNILNQLEFPQYYQACKGRNSILNAKKHTNRMETINLDIANYFPNTKNKYVEIFFKTKLKITGAALNLLMLLTTFNGHLPTGAPTSCNLAFWAHFEIFNRIYNKMKKNNICMTLFVDDMSISAKSHIGGWVVKFCREALKKHCLWIKTSKIKHFGYKGTWVTGVKINQAGKLLVPFKQDKAVIDMLKEKDIVNMNESEIQKLLGKIGYIQQIAPKRFIATKKKAQKRYKEINQLKHYYKQIVTILNIYLHNQSCC